MAFITIQTNVGILKEVQKEISDGIGKAVSLIPHQSADSILIVFDDNKAMYYQGDEPVALITVRAFGNEKHIGYREFSAQINQILHRTLHLQAVGFLWNFATSTPLAWGHFMPSVKQVKIYNFTDPMMGLSYESEPFFRRLDTHFGRQVALKTDVLDFDGFVAMIRHISCRQIVPTKPTLI